jgi:hypothetical protein
MKSGGAGGDGKYRWLGAPDREAPGHQDRAGSVHEHAVRDASEGQPFDSRAATRADYDHVASAPAGHLDDDACGIALEYAPLRRASGA